ncbi:MAG: ATP-binding cassette domain-containing protein [Acholeplasmataceae bacterium]|jgi:putative ABC transport system permease protein
MIKISNLNKTYTTGNFTIKACDNVSLEFRKEEFVAIIGPSGCGKTTFLNILGALLRPDSGNIEIYGNSIIEFDDNKLDRYRNHTIGYIFQTYNLIEHLNVLDNVMLGLALSGVKSKARKEKALRALEKVGILEQAYKKPKELSVGQAQRVAIARTLVNDPDIILADEPTGALDSEMSKTIISLFKELTKDKLVIIVTHNEELAYEYATRIIKLTDGRVVSDSNPYKSIDNLGKQLNLKNNSMSLFTSINLAFKNLKTKIGRTLLIVIASLFGVIGIYLIATLSIGLKKEYHRYQENKLSQYAINISANYSNVTLTPRDNTEFDEEKGNMNKITQEFVDYINDYYEENPDNISGITIKPRFMFSILKSQEDENGVITYKRMATNYGPYTARINQKFSLYVLLPKGEKFNLTYDILAGTHPDNITDKENKVFGIVLPVDICNRFYNHVFETMGYYYKDNDHIPFETILNMEFLFYPGVYSSTNFDIENTVKLKICAIVRHKDRYQDVLIPSGLGYTHDLVEYLAHNYPNVVGDTDYIDIYPTSSKARSEIKDYLKKYNDRFDPNDKENNIVYYDEFEVLSKKSQKLIMIIMVSLTCFTIVAIVISITMNTIVTQTSVLQRSREIGIIRALGGRKKDVFRIFNTENIIVGIISGIIGLLVSFLIINYLNDFVEKNFNTRNVLINLPVPALITFILVLIISFLAGIIPARKAAIKDPVEVLYSE